jgi:RND family efflux transporter MFP subunit
MPWRVLTQPLKWVVTLAVFAGLLGLAHLAHEEAKEERAREKGGEKKAEKPKGPEGVVELDPEAVKELKIQTTAARETKWRKHFVVYGRVVPNPRATAELRAAFAGTVRDADKPAWPMPGGPVQAGKVLGRLDIRVGPQERLDLETKLAEARLKEQGAKDVLAVHEERLSRLRMAGGGVSQAELDTARVQAAEARMKLAVARGAVAIWEGALKAIAGRKASAWSQPLAAPLSGEVVQLAALPGAVVQPGDLLVRVVDFRRVLARVDFSAAALAQGSPPQLELAAVAGPSEDTKTRMPFVKARRVGPAPQVDATSQLAGYWYEVAASADAPGPVWRPGLFVNGQYADPAADEQSAVAVPLTALLYHEGRTVVYVREGPKKFERRKVQVLGQEGTEAFLSEGVRAGEAVVSARAQVLLSRERQGEGDND